MAAPKHLKKTFKIGDKEYEHAQEGSALLVPVKAGTAPIEEFDFLGEVISELNKPDEVVITPEVYSSAHNIVPLTLSLEKLTSAMEEVKKKFGKVAWDDIGNEMISESEFAALDEALGSDMTSVAQLQFGALTNMSDTSEPAKITLGGDQVHSAAMSYLQKQDVTEEQKKQLIDLVFKGMEMDQKPKPKTNKVLTAHVFEFEGFDKENHCYWWKAKGFGGSGEPVLAMAGWTTDMIKSVWNEAIQHQSKSMVPYGYYAAEHRLKTAHGGAHGGYLAVWPKELNEDYGTASPEDHPVLKEVQELKAEIAKETEMSNHKILPNGVNVELWRDIKTMTYELEIGGYNQHDGKSMRVVSLTVEQNDPGAAHEVKGPLLRLTYDHVQRLMDNLWEQGVRPTKYQDQDVLKATKEHLEDMRKIAMSYIDLQK